MTRLKVLGAEEPAPRTTTGTWGPIHDVTGAHVRPIPAAPSKLMGASAPHDYRSWSTITWPGNALFIVFLLVALLFVFLAVRR